MASKAQLLALAHKYNVPVSEDATGKQIYNLLEEHALAPRQITALTPGVVPTTHGTFRNLLPEHAQRFAQVIGRSRVPVSLPASEVVPSARGSFNPYGGLDHLFPTTSGALPPAAEGPVGGAGVAPVGNPGPVNELSPMMRFAAQNPIIAVGLFLLAVAITDYMARQVWSLFSPIPDPKQLANSIATKEKELALRDSTIKTLESAKKTLTGELESVKGNLDQCAAVRGNLTAEIPGMKQRTNDAIELARKFRDELDKCNKQK